MKLSSRAALSLLLALGLCGCTMSSTANKWNDRVGPNGRPVYIKSHTNIGVNLLIFLKLFGATSLPYEIDLLTEEIAEEGGDVVRMIESSSENYWYGFPPFTWILTPVVTTVSADYEPSAEVLERDRAQAAAARLKE